MKLKSLVLNWKMLITLFVFNLMTLAVLAQEESGGGGGSSSSTTSTTKTVGVSVTESENWYASPWLWIIGAAVFILLLVALMSGGRRSSAASDRVTVTKTVERDTDV